MKKHFKNIVFVLAGILIVIIVVTLIAKSDPVSDSEVTTLPVTDQMSLLENNGAGEIGDGSIKGNDNREIAHTVSAAPEYPRDEMIYFDLEAGDASIIDEALRLYTTSQSASGREALTEGFGIFVTLKPEIFIEKFHAYRNDKNIPEHLRTACPFGSLGEEFIDESDRVINMEIDRRVRIIQNAIIPKYQEETRQWMLDCFNNRRESSEE